MRNIADRWGTILCNHAGIIDSYLLLFARRWGLQEEQ